MPSFTTIDSGGRVVIPKALRESLRLLPNTRLRVIERDRRVVLEPVEDAPVLIERDGLVLIGGELVGPPPDVRTLRQERIDQLARRATGRRRG
jgi:AbrB family looped-hinge helix DNA binding protein